MTGSLAVTLLAALGAALVLGAIAHRLRMAPMIGYIAAGLLVGPFTPGFVADREEVLGLADIGVALLMFSIGVRFRRSELLEVGRAVLVGAPLQVAISMALGAGVATLMGSGVLQALFLGAVVSVCSSVVLVKVAGESTLESTLHGRLALGWSIVQDLITVVLVVVLSALASDAENPLLEVGVATLLALGFVAAVLVIGSRVLPVILSRVALLGERELFVLAVAVLAIGTAAVAQQVGVSVALGAFVAGLALAESDLAASVLGEIAPLRELFATFFFVSVGILLRPDAVLEAWPSVLVLLVLIVLGKALPMAGLLRLQGQAASTSVRAAGLVAQGGEFSFVLATVGLQLGALEGGAFSQAMGAVVLSILLARPVSIAAERLAAALAARRPADAVPPDLLSLRRHVVILGYGVVGRTVARVLTARSIPWLAVEADYRLVRTARRDGKPVLYGDAGSAAVLDVAGVEAASTLVVALPDPLAVRHAIAHAVLRNPRVHVVARARSLADESELERLGAARVITAERQLGHEMVRHTLRRYGVNEREIDAILRRG
jgi:CPA2 family monovalent cation:H+ antiporter-2